MNLLQKTFWSLFACFSLLTIWVSVALGQANTWPDFRGNMFGVGGVTWPLTATGDLNMNGYSIIGKSQQTSDAATASSTYRCGQDAYEAATVNNDGGTCYFGSGFGRRTLTVQSVDAQADNDRLYYYNNGASPAFVTAKNGGAGAGQFNCQTNIATCACSLYTYFITNPITNVVVSRTDGTCSDAKVFFDASDNINSHFSLAVYNSAGNIFAYLSQGVDGNVVMNGRGIIGSGFSPTSGFGWYGKQLNDAAGSTISQATNVSKSPAIYYSDLIQSYYNGSGAALEVWFRDNTSFFGGTISTPYNAFGFTGIAGEIKLVNTIINGATNGKFIVKNSAGTSGAGLDILTINRLSLTKLDGTTLGEIAELLVGTITAVDMSSVARQTLYTVPAGFTFYPKKVCVGPCSAAIDAATGGFGSDTPAQDFFAASLMTHTAAASEACFFPAAGVAAPSIAAAGTFAYDGTVAEGAADTCTMNVFGILR